MIFQGGGGSGPPVPPSGSTLDGRKVRAKKKYGNMKVEEMERSGSVVECLTRDRGAAGSSLTGVTVLCP